LSLLNGVSCIVRVFFVAPKVCNPTNDFFRVMAPCQGTLGKSPVPF